MLPKRARVLFDSPSAEEKRFQPKKMQMKKDRLGRPHFVTPYTGPSYLFLRNNEQDGSTIETHTNEVLYLFNSGRIEKKKNLVIIAGKFHINHNRKG